MSTILETRRVPWPDEAACAASARAMAAHGAIGNAFIELHGPLGAGKTTFARHLLHALGVAGRVKSPTYALMETYTADEAHGAFAIAHFDFYRFDDAQEWEDAGFREVFAEAGTKLVEWPEKAAGLLPACDLRITIAPRDFTALRVGFDHDPDPDDPAGALGSARDVCFEALSRIGRELLP